MNRTRSYSTQAIVLRRNDYGEADRLVTILRPDMGKQRVLAKGARKITSRKAGHIELFTRTQLLLAKGRNFDLITQAELIEPYRKLRDDMNRGRFAHYLCELVEQFAPEDSEGAALYDLLAEGLMWLCEATDPALATRYFEMRLLTLEGYRPDLFKCARTGAALEVDIAQRKAAGSGTRGARKLPDTPFSPIEGGTLSSKAAADARDVVMLSASTLTLLRALQTEAFGAIDRLDVRRQVKDEAERALQHYLDAVIERRLRSATLIRQLARE
jgi:DNA repair protein RecO (recombination protein O)